MLGRGCLFFLLCLSASGSDRTIAQFVHKAWVGKDGAPANIMAITQTKDGYLWLASSQGLYRFDGVEFERFKLSGQQLTSASIYSLLSCPNGDLWVGSAVSGIRLLRNGTDRTYIARDGFPEGAVLSIAQDRQGSIWAATQGGLARFDGAKWQKIGPESGFEGTPVSLYADRNGTVWAGSPETIFSLPQGADTFRRTGLRTLFVSHMLESPNGTIWMAETVRGAVRPMPPSANDPEILLGSRQILFDREGSLWITTLGDGLRRVRYADRLTHEKFGKSSGEIESYMAKEGLSADYATSVYQDHEGNVWVGTAGGLDRFNKGAVVHPPVPGMFTYTAMAPDEGGDIWAGCLSGATGRIHDHKWFPGPFGFATFSIVSDPNGGSWWATFKFGYREISGRFTKFQFPQAYATNILPAQIALDRSGALWLSGTFGMFVRRGGAWERIDLPDGFPGKNPKVAYTDAAGRLWFGYQENSILLIDGAIRRVLSAKNGLRAGAVKAIFVSGSSTWIAGSQGLQLFDGERFREIAPAGGESFGSVSGVLEISDGSLWLNAYNGIVRIAPAAVSKLKAGAISAEYSIFDTYDGLPGATQQSQPYPTLIQATDGKLWFGTSGGPVWIDPNDIPRNKLQPPVEVRSLTANGKRYVSFSDLGLPPLTRDLEINYTALSFAVPERVRYRYKLEGSDKNWREAGTRRQAFYTNLRPGPYSFRVTACNNDGVWNEAGAAVAFRIDPAFYQTIWFQASYYAAGLALLWLLYRFRLQQAAAQMHSRLEGRIAERERIARDLHDTLLQSFQGMMLRLRAVDSLLPEGKAKEQLERTIQRADQAIAEGRSAVYDLRSSASTTTDLAQAVKALGDELVTPESAAFRLVVEGTARELHPIIRDELYCITREAFRNAFSHARAHHIETEITYGERALRLRIRDDGQGIPPEILNEGRPGHYGLPGMRERAEQIGGKLDIWSGDGTGTEIEFSIKGSIAYATSIGRSLFPLFRKKGR